MSNLLERLFHLKEHGSNVKTELLAGLTTFSTMAYIIVVNPAILSSTGMDFGSVMVATILAASFATLFMGLCANYPFALAPSMGLNAYFTYGVVTGLGLSWQTALAACFFAAVTLIILNITGIRQALLEATPACLRIGTTSGIGIFLAFIGLKETKLVIQHPDTFVTLGNIAEPYAAMTLAGVIIITALLAYQVRGAILWAILILWGIGLATGLTEWKGLTAMPPSIAPTLFSLDFASALDPRVIGVTLSFVFVMIFDAAGTLLSLCSHGEFLDEQAKIPRVRKALSADALGSLFGSLLGTSPMSNYLESAAGITSGGRTGLTSTIVGLLFLITLFFSPLATAIPSFATSAAMIMIGALMTSQLKKLPWDDISEMVPGFITLVAIPLTFNIAAGIGLGFIAFALLKLLTGKARETSPLIWVITALFIGAQLSIKI